VSFFPKVSILGICLVKVLEKKPKAKKAEAKSISASVVIFLIVINQFLK
jgi:hypothetical protein